MENNPLIHFVDDALISHQRYNSFQIASHLFQYNISFIPVQLHEYDDERQLEEEQFETILDTLPILHLISQKPLLLLDHETKLYPESILLPSTDHLIPLLNIDYRWSIIRSSIHVHRSTHEWRFYARSFHDRNSPGSSDASSVYRLVSYRREPAAQQTPLTFFINGLHGFVISLSRSSSHGRGRIGIGLPDTD